jgi:hypothetical protein
MSGPTIAVNLTRAEAIVLFEFLFRFRDEDRLVVEHEAEQLLLRDL